MFNVIRGYFILLLKFFKNLSQFIKYQLITKGILVLFILPIYSFLSHYLVNRNTKTLTNGEVLKFLFSQSGISYLALMLFIIVAEIIIEIGGYIIISCKIEGGYGESSYLGILKQSFKLLPRMFSVGGLIVLAYVILIVPLTGIGIRLSFLKSMDIPNFIMSVINDNMVYKGIYLAGITVLLIFSIRLIFTFHYMIVDDLDATKAIKASSELVNTNKKKLFIEIISVLIISVILSFILLFIWFSLIAFLSNKINFESIFGRFLMIFLLQLQNIGLLLVSMLIIPFECQHITKVFYALYLGEEKRYPDIKLKLKPSLLDRIFIKKRTLTAVTIITMVIISLPMAVFTKELLGYNNQILVMGHRGFGRGTPENSISSAQKSIDEKLDFVEIDVQRTKDRIYVLNHDKTFRRVSANKPYYIDKLVTELTFDQIEKLDIGSKIGKEYSGEKVPTIESILDTAKGKIKVNIELKEDVDKKMIDDIMNIIDQKGMREQVILTSLDINNINYIEEKNGSFKTGIIYFLALGNIKNVRADYLIMEEREATDSNIDKIHSLGKYVIVWTVNSDDSIEKFTKKNIDGVITDYPNKVKKEIERNSKLSVEDIILSNFITEFNILE
ncbi:glycerophosphoryl diester phosphodiesterase membrane domain-containing protein [Peptostreptococcus canis]|uniref:GP-PDE domain-containing protein n=1 Tax=Peptostreptococcus canis TaxID=1159213 RepID=A0ABR6TLZ6_9FIRM|nr:glycerophosphoryl diester phosphodiesterase membrane domain-containing protein [Peptostreptococcus canis]MBC2576434.1 hypothetical protein [Peptostreptococcus canis]MBP1998409.1 glycerophosphoryl diester phosphodiesterase [Peptostreptococcus canis]